MRVRQVIVAMRKQADWKIICGVRTYDEQDALYNKRPRVTRARGGQSMHNFGLAADFCLFEDGQDIWSPSEGPKSIYAPLAEATRQAGLVWGGDFRAIYDPGHIQLGEIATTALHRAAIRRCRALFLHFLSEMHKSGPHIFIHKMANKN